MGSGIEQVVAALADTGYKVAGAARCFSDDGKCCGIRYQLRWFDNGCVAATPGLVDDLARDHGLRWLAWR